MQPEIVQEYVMTNVEAKLERDLEEISKKTLEYRKKVLLDRLEVSYRELACIRQKRENLIKQQIEIEESFWWWTPKSRRVKYLTEKELDVCDYQEHREKNNISEIQLKLGGL
jgi:hypothetical protein